VEDSLDDQLVRLHLPNGSADGANRIRREPHTNSNSQRAGAAQCIDNLARIKEAVAKPVQKPTDFSVQRWDNVSICCAASPRGLLMLSKGRG